MTNRPGRNSDKLVVRFPDGMKAKLERAAAISNRSLNAEIISRLERSLSEFSRMDDMQMDVIKSVYQGMVSGMAEYLIQQGLDVSKEKIEEYIRDKNREFMQQVADTPD